MPGLSVEGFGDFRVFFEGFFDCRRNDGAVPLCGYPVSISRRLA